MNLSPLPPSFYSRHDALHLAPLLLGKTIYIHSRGITARIVEVEAYMGRDDKACHASDGRRTPRTEVMFCRGGVYYVYLIYGMYHCLNVVSGEKDSGEAVLIRSVEIIDGKDEASILRYGKDFSSLTISQKKNLSNGPGKICKALGIDRSLNGTSCHSGEIIICDAPPVDDRCIKTSPRIGVDYAGSDALLPYRFYVEE
ncbi:MAG: DNA-3-methyladenine glycosylase [Flavobacteriales bacterium]|nr:DNA-3-methyladenine glycosylase [Flavobacteriales bacterium]